MFLKCSNNNWGFNNHFNKNYFVPACSELKDNSTNSYYYEAVKKAQDFSKLKHEIINNKNLKDISDWYSKNYPGKSIIDQYFDENGWQDEASLIGALQYAFEKIFNLKYRELHSNFREKDTNKNTNYEKEKPLDVKRDVHFKTNQLKSFFNNKNEITFRDILKAKYNMLLNNYNTEEQKGLSEEFISKSFETLKQINDLREEFLTVQESWGDYGFILYQDEKNNRNFKVGYFTKKLWW